MPAIFPFKYLPSNRKPKTYNTALSISQAIIPITVETTYATMFAPKPKNIVPIAAIIAGSKIKTIE
jgi:hypothetical protein